MKDEHLLISLSPPPPPDVGGLTQKGLGPMTFMDFAIIAGVVGIGALAVMVKLVYGTT